MDTASSPGGKSPRRICPKTGNVIASPLRRFRSRWWLGLYVVTGLSALVWFLVRVLPKPSRAAYPCQRVAMPLASAFVLWLIGLAGTIFAFRRAKRFLLQARYLLAVLCVVAGLSIVFFALSLPLEPVPADWTPTDPPNSPVGVAKGVHPGRVVWVHDPEATNWDGSSDYWWADDNTDPELVDAMVSKAIRRIAGASSDAEAWNAIFHYFNRTHGRGDVGYQAGEGIAIKINLNVAGDYSLTNEPIPSPQVVRALLAQLVEEAGVTESAISVYDASRCITDAVFSPCHRDFPAVQFFDTSGQGDRGQAQPDPAVAVHYADSRVGNSGTSRLPQCVVSATYLVNLALLRGHSLAGVTLCAKNHFGSVWRPGGGFSPSNIHTSIDKNANSLGARNSLVDLMGHEHLDGKALLFMIDALYAAVNQGSSRPSRWRSSPFDNDWTSSLFVSQDGVAMDSVALDFCRSEPTLDGQVTGNSVDNYLHEAALADDPPSGAVYDPEGDGTRLASLGVHEHWNNAQDKQYSRNLGTGDGIELVYVPNLGGFQRGDSNADGGFDISDAVTTLMHLFVEGGDSPACLSSADADDSGAVDITDAIFFLNFLFAAGNEPPPPFGDCGDDPTPDDLGCESYPPCGGGAGTRQKLLSVDDPATVLIPTDGSLELGWIQLDFDDTGWIPGQAAVGYDENDDYGASIHTDVEAEMLGVNTTAYIRVPFTLDEPLSASRLTLWVQYDDGFIAYINGTKVAERNAPPDPAWNSSAAGSHDDSLAIAFEPIDISDFRDRLAAGENLLAVHGLNVDLTSSDFLIGVELEARTP